MILLLLFLLFFKSARAVSREETRNPRLRVLRCRHYTRSPLTSSPKRFNVANDRANAQYEYSTDDPWIITIGCALNVSRAIRRGATDDARSRRERVAVTLVAFWLKRMRGRRTGGVGGTEGRKKGGKGKMWGGGPRVSLVLRVFASPYERLTTGSPILARWKKSSFGLT